MTEVLLACVEVTDKDFAEAGQVAKTLSPHADVHWSSNFRLNLTGMLVRRALKAATRSAGKGLNTIYIELGESAQFSRRPVGLDPSCDNRAETYNGIRLQIRAAVQVVKLSLEPLLVEPRHPSAIGALEIIEPFQGPPLALSAAEVAA